jgi:ubiquinone/menaquinone biosynthesis C-methylase UbiE
MSQRTETFRALADTTRLRILTLLRTMELSVGELALVLGQSQPRVSRHIKILIDTGLIARRKEGSWVFLSPGDPKRLEPLFALFDRWAAIDGPDHWAEADKARLAAVRADRAAAAERYFARHAAQWDELRSLHVGESEVEEAICRALANRPLGRLLDIGTGTGRMIVLLGSRAEQALGIDRSVEMLRVARENLARADIAADFRQGDMYALPLPDGSADTIVLHQVLHYAQQPPGAIAEAARVLAPGGRLLIVDFAPHDREELRDRDAHARLGFADEVMLDWLQSAGLAGRVAEHLGGELTVTLWLADKAKSSRLKAVA